MQRTIIIALFFSFYGISTGMKWLRHLVTSLFLDNYSKDFEDSKCIMLAYKKVRGNPESLDVNVVRALDL